MISGLIYERAHERLVLPYPWFVFHSFKRHSVLPSLTAASVGPPKTCEKDVVYTLELLALRERQHRPGLWEEEGSPK